MPSESLPRDRKEFFRERRVDRFETLGGGSPSAGGGRWRDLRRPTGEFFLFLFLFMEFFF